MINIKEDIQPLTTFRNNSAAMMKRLKKTGRPMVLTVNGQSEAVVLSAAAFQRMEDEKQRALDIAADADVREGIRQGLEDMQAGRTRPFDEFWAEFRRERGLPARNL